MTLVQHIERVLCHHFPNASGAVVARARDEIMAEVQAQLRTAIDDLRENMR